MEAKQPSGRRAFPGPTLPGVALLALALGIVAPETVVAQFPDSTRAVDPLDSLRLSEPLSADSTTAVPAPLPEEVVVHLGHLSDTFTDAPGGMGLIPTGMAEAEIAARYVRLAGRDSTNLGNMRRNMGHVLHAIDPVEVGNGDGLDYGFKRAARGVLTHVELAMAVEGASETVRFHGPYIARAARGASARADEAIATARRIQAATDARQAHRMVNQLAHLVRAMAYGDDRDGDGRIGYAEDESGLAQATYHLELVRRVEGLQPRRGR